MSHSDNPATARTTADSRVPWILRTGVALCFIGHGAFGIITKQAWVPYFAVAGISEPSAWRLMPWIGTMDVAIGFLAFVWPCRALFIWAATWAVWTALLRPLAGQGWSEFFERAGNYGVPLAILVIVGLHAPWFARLPERWDALADAVVQRQLAWTLRLTTATLLAGHAGCALLLQKEALAHHYAVFWPNSSVEVMMVVGGLECALAVGAFIMPIPGMLLALSLWKLATESLFLLSGTPAPTFEVIERGGSYVAPLAFAVLLWRCEADSLPHPAPAT